MTFSSLGDLMYDIGLSYPVYDQNNKYQYKDTYLLGNLEQSGSYLHSGSLGKWSFSSAIEVARNVFIGGTLNIYSGEFKSTEEFYEKDTRNIYGMNVWTDTTDPTTADFRQFSMKENLLWDISGWDAKIGFLYQIRKFARFGATIKFPTSFSIKEDYSVSVESEFGTGASYNSDTGEPYHQEYGITTPFIISGGASFNLMGLILSGDISFVDFTQMEFDEGKDIPMEDVSDINRDIKDLYRSVVNLNAGLEYTIPNAGIRLRGGFIYNPSPYQGDPSERNRKYVTGGIGFLADETFAFDMAYAYGWWKDIGENYQPNGSSTTFQDITVSNLIFTFSYRF
jgi:long-subunit fatty acid transport protein